MKKEGKNFNFIWAVSIVVVLVIGAALVLKKDNSGVSGNSVRDLVNWFNHLLGQSQKAEVSISP